MFVADGSCEQEIEGLGREGYFERSLEGTFIVAIAGETCAIGSLGLESWELEEELISFNSSLFSFDNNPEVLPEI